MKVILNKDYQSLGEEGDVVNVKRGYARNFLIPQGIAVYDTPSTQAMFRSKAAAIAKRKEEKKAKSADVKTKLEGMEVKFTMPVSDTGKLFGSVTTHMIAEYLLKEGIEVERKKIEINSKDIKTPGNYNFTISLYGGATANVKLSIEAEKK